MKRIWTIKANFSDFRNLSEGIKVMDLYIPSVDSIDIVDVLVNPNAVIIAFAIDNESYNKLDPKYISRKILLVDSGVPFTLTPAFDNAQKEKMQAASEKGVSLIKQEPDYNEYIILKYDFILDKTILLENR